MDEEKKKTSSTKKSNGTKKKMSTKATNKKSTTKKVSSTKKVNNTKKNNVKNTFESKNGTKKINSNKKTNVKNEASKGVVKDNKKTTKTNKKTTSTKKKTVKNEDIKKQEEVKVVEKKENKKTKIILDIIIYVFILVICVCLVLLYFKNKQDKETIKEIKETVISKDTETLPEKIVKDYINDLQVKFNNKDILGILNVDGLDVSIPLVKGSDNKYYLKHAVNKKKSVIGSVFVDYRHDAGSKQINIYGHNSTKFDPPFKVLEGYLEKKYYEEHKYFELLIDNETRKYEIFSVIIANKEDSEEHMQFDYKKDSEWLKHYQRLKKRSKYKTEASISESDNIVVLQTCIFGRYHDKLLVIVGKEIERK